MGLDRTHWLRRIATLDPETAYEVELFGFDPGAVAVSDATLDLMATFPPSDRAPKQVVPWLVLSLMDDALLDAFGHAHPTAVQRRVYLGAVDVAGPGTFRAASPGRSSGRSSGRSTAEEAAG